jgi:hypothetical protein
MRQKGSRSDSRIIYSGEVSLKTWMRGSSPRKTDVRQCGPTSWPVLRSVMAGHSRTKDGVLSHAYVPAIHDLLLCQALNTWMPGTGPGMTTERAAVVHCAKKVVDVRHKAGHDASIQRGRA